MDPWILHCLPRSCALPNGGSPSKVDGRALSMVLQGTWSVRFSVCFESLRGRLGSGYPCRVLTFSALIAPGRRLFSAPTAGDGPLLRLWRRESYTPLLLRGNGWITQGLSLRRGSRLSSGNIRAWASIEQAHLALHGKRAATLLLALVGS